MKLTKLFSSEPGEISELRKVVEQNETDIQWRSSFQREAADNKLESDRLSEQLGRVPTEATARQFVEAHAKVSMYEQALVSASHRAVDPINRQCVKRTKPVLRAALESLKKRLLDEKTEVMKSDRESATRLGADLGDITSPLIKKFDEESNRAQSYAAGIEAANDMAKLSPAIKFCLG